MFLLRMYVVYDAIRSIGETTSNKSFFCLSSSRDVRLFVFVFGLISLRVSLLFVCPSGTKGSTPTININNI